VNLEHCASIQMQCWLTVLCSETRPNAKPKTVPQEEQPEKVKNAIFDFLMEK